MDPSTDSPQPADDAAWRRWRTRFYFALLVAMMLAIAVAGWLNLRRLRGP